MKKKEFKKEKIIKLKLKNQNKRLFIYEIITIFLLIILGIFTLSIYSELKSYDSFLGEKDEALILNSMNDAGFSGDIYFYFYFKHNKSKEEVLEVYSYKVLDNKIVKSKYLFDMKVK